MHARRHARAFADADAAAALATIDLLEEGLMANAAARGAQFMEGLRALQLSIECIGDVRGIGLMIGVELVKNRETKERAPDWRNAVVQEAFARGLLLLGCGENSIRICPALTISREEVDTSLTILEEALRAVAG